MPTRAAFPSPLPLSMQSPAAPRAGAFALYRLQPRRRAAGRRVLLETRQTISAVSLLPNHPRSHNPNTTTSTLAHALNGTPRPTKNARGAARARWVNIRVPVWPYLIKEGLTGPSACIIASRGSNVQRAASGAGRVPLPPPGRRRALQTTGVAPPFNPFAPRVKSLLRPGFHGEYLLPVRPARGLTGLLGVAAPPL